MLAVIMGLMLAFDMGGPVNKVAYAFMLICVAQGVYTVVAIAAVGICVPPLGMGLATLIGRKNFSAEERETGKAALVMGCGNCGAGRCAVLCRLGWSDCTAGG